MGREIILFAQDDPQAAADRIPSDADAVDAAPHHEQVAGERGGRTRSGIVNVSCEPEGRVGH